MKRIVVLGNSSSGKSTLSKRLGLAHLDLDTLAWLPGPIRRPLDESRRDIESFLVANTSSWVIEGCYADLAALVLDRTTHFLFLNPDVETCIANAKARPWEPHKYDSKEAQDANLEMLIGWIRAYETRDDEQSLAAHRRLFDGFPGTKTELRSREAIAAWGL